MRCFQPLAHTPCHHRQPVGEFVLDDWRRAVARRADLAQALTATGYREFRPRSGAPPARGDHMADAATDEPTADEHLRVLVHEASDSVEAARVVLQRLLPGLLSIARRRRRLTDGTHAALDELLAAGWIVIRMYPISRRPYRVAANLLRDIEYQAFTRPRRLAMAREDPLDDRDLHPRAERSRSPAVDAAEELDDLLAMAAQAGVCEADLAFVRKLARGESIDELAAAEGVTSRALRYRRQRITERLKEVAMVA
jgi:hypothetical protein